MEEWKRTPVATCESLVNSMPKRVKAMLKNNGGHTKYWHFGPNLYIYIYIYIYICMYVYVCMCMYIYIYIYMYVYVCMYVCMYMYIYMYICITFYIFFCIMLIISLEKTFIKLERSILVIHNFWTSHLITLTGMLQQGSSMTGTDILPCRLSLVR